MYQGIGLEGGKGGDLRPYRRAGLPCGAGTVVRKAFAFVTLTWALWALLLPFAASFQEGSAGTGLMYYWTELSNATTDTVSSFDWANRHPKRKQSLFLLSCRLLYLY